MILAALVVATAASWLAVPALATEVEDTRSYSVGGGAELSPAPTAEDAAAWATFVKIATPETAAELLTTYSVYEDADDDTHASVAQDAEDPSRWSLEVNAAGEAGDELEQTMVHEYAHLLSLNPDEVTVDAPSCTTLQLAEGCAMAGSMLVAFHDQFWAQYGTSAPDINNADAEVGADFYQQHEDAFVDDYAATNVVEDFAETYMVFVVEDRPDSDSAVAQKLDFFWDRAGEVERRDRIRTALGWEDGATSLTSAPPAGAIEQSVPRAAVVTIAVLSAVVVLLTVAFVVWMRRRAKAEAAELSSGPDSSTGPERSSAPERSTGPDAGASQL